MNRILVITNAALLIVVIGLYALMSAGEKTNRQLRLQLAEWKAKQAAPPDPALQPTTSHEVCRSQITQLTALLSNSAFQLEVAQARLRDYETQAIAPAPLVTVTAAPPAAAEGSSRRTPAPPAGVRSAGPHLFETLLATNGQVLGRNLEFSAVYGRRVAFKEAGSSRRVAFDVEQIDPRLLGELGIDVEAQKAQHARQELAWRQAEAAGLAMAAAEEQKRQERRAAEAAARAEAEKLRAEQMQTGPEGPANPVPGAGGDPGGPPAAPAPPALTPGWR